MLLSFVQARQRFTNTTYCNCTFVLWSLWFRLENMCKRGLRGYFIILFYLTRSTGTAQRFIGPLFARDPWHAGRLDSEAISLLRHLKGSGYGYAVASSIEERIRRLSLFFLFISSEIMSHYTSPPTLDHWSPAQVLLSRGKGANLLRNVRKLPQPFSDKFAA